MWAGITDIQLCWRRRLFIDVESSLIGERARQRISRWENMGAGGGGGETLKEKTNEVKNKMMKWEAHYTVTTEIVQA